MLSLSSVPVSYASIAVRDSGPILCLSVSCSPVSLIFFYFPYIFLSPFCLLSHVIPYILVVPCSVLSTSLQFLVLPCFFISILSPFRQYPIYFLLSLVMSYLFFLLFSCLFLSDECFVFIVLSFKACLFSLH